MKKALVILLIAGVLAGAGCGTLFQRHEVVTPTLSTNALSGAVITVLHTNIVYQVNPAVSNALSKGEVIATSAPAPWGPVAAGGLGVLSGVLGLIAKVKSDKVTSSMIVGIEKAPNNEAVKESVQAVASANGVQDRLHAAVKKLTGP